MKENDFYYGNLETNIHIYSGALIVGDAFKIIDAIKKGNAYFDLFYDNNKSDFKNRINEIKKNEIVNHTSLTSGGFGL